MVNNDIDEKKFPKNFSWAFRRLNLPHQHNDVFRPHQNCFLAQALTRPLPPNSPVFRPSFSFPPPPPSLPLPPHSVSTKLARITAVLPPSTPGWNACVNQPLHSSPTAAILASAHIAS